ncbi:putative RND superfamily exporter protein [Natranaerovirga pectinivora]|uniref:Putative RND superfamily exporter protein n=1 Tax=Natranaerovirga pectinivora TaxID=682400 RepID=A0A4R3MLJ4_9FIRM|nr:MMPL family transporter [Natranaerovirga pectinivora]TCT14886.1 putative RND superfamily exporter protein [Natranaerovirga pectinivora]
MYKLENMIIKHYKKILIMSLFIFVITAFAASKLKISSDMEEMLPKDSKILESSNEFDQYFDSQESGIVVVKGEKEKIKPFMRDLEKEILQRQVSVEILYNIDLKEVEDYSMLFLDIQVYQDIDNAMKSTDLETINTILLSISNEKDIPDEDLIQYITNEEENIFLMMLRPKIERNNFLESREEFYDEIRSSINTLLNEETYRNIEAGLTGGAFIQDIEADRVAFDGFFGTFLITICLIILLIVISFRRTILLSSVIYPLVLGALIAATFAYGVYGSINMFSMSFALLLVGLGIDFAIHLISRYIEEREKEIDVVTSVRISLKKTGVSIVTGAITTSVAFFAFVLAKFKAFEQMGIISAIGVFALCITMLIIVPSLILLIDHNKQIKVTKKKANFKFLNSIGLKIEKRPYLIIFVITLLIPLFYLNVKNTEIVGDMDKIYPDNIESKKWEEIIKEGFGYNPNTLTFMVEDENMLINAIEVLEKRDDVERVLSIYEYLPKDQGYKLEVIRNLENFLLSMGYENLEGFNIEKMKIIDLPDNLQGNYVGLEGRLLVEVIPSVNIYEEEHYKNLEEVILKVSGNTPVSMAAIMNEVVAMVKEDIVRISIICIVIVAVFLLIVFKSFKDMVIAIAPVILTLYFTIGVLPLLDKDINVLSIAAFPLLIGIGIDSSIHLLHRLKSEDERNIGYVLMTTGKAIVLTALTTLIGFGGLTFINHPGMANLGFTVALGLLICIIITLTLIPALFLILYSSKTVVNDKSS